jgi:hypothetical protein
VTKYRVTFTTTAEVTVDIESDQSDLLIYGEDELAERAWAIAEEYLQTLAPDSHGAAIQVSLDGIGADTVEYAP